MFATDAVVVPAAVARLEVRRVDRQRLVAQRDRQRDAVVLRHQVQRPGQPPRLQERAERAPERVVVRHADHADRGAPVGHVDEQRLGVAVAQPEVLAQRETGEELGAGEVAPAEPAGVGRGPEAKAKVMGAAEDFAGRSATLHPAGCTDAGRVALPNTRRTHRGSRLSRTGPIFPSRHCKSRFVVDRSGARLAFLVSSAETRQPFSASGLKSIADHQTAHQVWKYRGERVG